MSPVLRAASRQVELAQGSERHPVAPVAFWVRGAHHRAGHNALREAPPAAAAGLSVATADAYSPLGDLLALPFVPKLGRTLKELPMESGECSTAATKGVGVLSETYSDAVVVQITDAGGPRHFWAASGTLIEEKGFHIAVFANGRFFGALTGAGGLPPAEYFELFKDLYPVVRRR